MKNFLRKRWHGIPIGIIAVLALVGVVAASYTFLSCINNRANSALTVTTGFVGDTYWFTFTGFPDGTVPASDGDDSNPEWSGTTSLKIKGDAPVGDYSVTLNFNRS